MYVTYTHVHSTSSSFCLHQYAYMVSKYTVLTTYPPLFLSFNNSYILNNADIDFDSSTLLSEAIIGAFAGGWGALLTNPFDIITTQNCRE